ncbi:TonB-dependent receptor [Terriglobus aquaticus]|uniref:Carboxypeptidase-like regulatory domain-containing protein n=2 Tax=Terriglobus aquaticus TaxID=940139 RepID=A0ABW9KJP7_9BACT
MLSCVAAAYGQSSTGSLFGTVTDTSGAVVPNATVSVVNVDTGVRTDVKTNGEGLYSLRFLQIGQYRVMVEAPGFRPYAVGPVTVETNLPLKVDSTLAIGSETSVSVNADVVPLLNTENGTVQAVVDAKTIDNVPINGRNFTQLTQFTPGIALTNQNQWNGATGNPNNSGVRQQSVATAPSINGNRMITNNYTLDGIQFFDSGANFSNAFGLPGYNPSPDAIQQVTVVSTNPAAEFGFGTGGQILTVLKSGTNSFHGSAYDYLQNWNQDANTWGNKRVANVASFTPRTRYTQQTFGGTLGGPIFRDKLFFFADYAGYRKPTSATSLYSVLPQAFRNGDFSALLTAANGSKQLYDSQNGYRAFANNQLPINNPVAKYLFAHPELYPLPNRTSPAADGVYQNYTGAAVKSLDRNDQGDIKIDYRISDRDSVFARASFSQARSGASNQGVGFALPLVSEFPFSSYAASYTRVFSPTILNEFRGGFTRIAYNSYNQDFTGVFGNNGDGLVGISLPFAQTAPGFTAQSFVQNASTPPSTLGTAASGRLALDNNYEYDDTLSIQRGRHQLRAGIQVVFYENNFQANPAGALGTFTYNGLYTGNPAAKSPNGYDLADWVLGYASASSISVGGTGRRGGRQIRSAYFFQDDFRVNDKLTLNLGLRYEYDQPFHEVQNRIAKIDIATGQLRLAGVNGNNRALYNPFYGQVDPRFGFAYQINPRTVVRGGFASTTFMDFNQFVSHATNRPFVNTATAAGVTPSATTGGTVINPANGFANVAAASTPTSYATWRDDLRPAFVPSYDLSLEYQLSNTQTLMAAYVGNIGNRLLNLRNINQLHNPVVGTSTEVAPYFALAGQTNTVTLFDQEGMQNYNAGEVIYRKRASRGITFTLNYTFAKNLTNAQGYAAPSNISGGSNYPQDSYNLRAEYGPAGFDIRQNLTSTFVAELPFGRGRAIGRNMNPVLDTLVGGWKVAGNATLYTGFPITVQANNAANTNQATGRANHYRKLVRRNPKFLPVVQATTASGAGQYGWWGNDPSATPCTTPGVDNGICAYGVPAAGTYGNAGIGTERSPGFRGIDAAGFKNFHIWRENNLVFRVDAYNVGNIASYNNPGRSVATPSTFGLVQSTRSQQRQIQFALKYTF